MTSTQIVRELVDGEWETRFETETGGGDGSLTQDIVGNGYTVASANVRSLKSFDAVGDMRFVVGVVSHGTASITSLTLIYEPDDVGRTVCVFVEGSGILGQRTITGYVSASEVTLDGTISNWGDGRAVIGTDNSAAIQAATAWMCEDSGRACEVDGSFLSAGPQQTGSVAGFDYSAQILFPPIHRSQSMASPKFFSRADPGGMAIPSADDGDYAGGSQILTTAGPTEAFFAVIPSPVEAAATGLAFSWVMPVFEGLHVRRIGGSGPSALNLYWAANAKVNNCLVDAVGLTDVLPVSTGPTSMDGVGVALPGGTNWGIAECIGTKIMGYEKALMHSDHAVIEVMIDTVGAGLCGGDPPALGRANTHPSTILKAEIQRCHLGIEPMYYHALTARIDCEVMDGGLVNDTSGYLSGELQVDDGNVLTFGPGLGVKQAASGRLFVRGVRNPVIAGPNVDLVDSLKTHPEYDGSTMFGVADGSNHVWYKGANASKDASGFFVTSGGEPNAISLQGPFYDSRKIVLTLHTSPTAGRTWMGALSRVVRGGGYDGLRVICSNNASGTGIYLYKGNFVELEHEAFVFATNTAYRITILTQQDSLDPATVKVTVAVNGASALEYDLSGGEAAIYVADGYDGLTGLVDSTADNGGSRLTDLSIRRANDL